MYNENAPRRNKLVLKTQIADHEIKYAFHVDLCA